jgi:hypothetical protein
MVPEVASGAAAELDDLRAACDTAVARLRAAAPDVVVLVGTGAETAWRTPDEYGSFRPWGVPIEVHVNGAGARPGLPLSLTIGAWLLSRQPAPVAAATAVASVAADEKPSGCAAFGRDECAARAARVALLAIGDGSAIGAVAAEGYVHARAESYDAEVARALAHADLDALLALGPGLAADVVSAGRPAWQVLAGAAAGTGWGADLLYSAAPYGVRYHVASWAAR